MKNLIIYAHPSHDGHCGAILQQVKTKLTQEKQPFFIIDLYKENFNPALPYNETLNSPQKTINPQIAKYQKLISASQNIIFIHPVWWNSTPAMLKGFFDRVLTPKYAYQFTATKIFGQNLPQGLLKGKQAIVINTIGSTAWASLLALQNIFNRQIKYHTLQFCGIKTKTFTLHNCRKFDKNDVDKKNKINNLVSRALKNIK